jgi:hypothetical protein
VQTWTSRPQTRQAGAAFAFAYLLRCRSCRLRGALVISPLPPMGQRTPTQEGPFAPQALPRFSAPTDPSATLSSAVDFPGVPVIRPPLLRRFPGGMRRASPVAEHVLVPMPSLPPRQSGPPRQPVCDGPYCRRLAGCRLGLWGCSLSGPPMRSLALQPGTSPPSRSWCSRAASESWFPVPLRSELQGSGFSPGRFASY